MAGLNINKSLGRLVGTVFAIAGSLMAIAGIIWLVQTAAFVSRAIKAPGLVVAMERSGGSAYFPVFTFTDAGGIVHTQRSSDGSSGFAFKAGEHVTVLYDAAAPKRSKIQSFQTVWLGPLFVTGFGLSFGGFATFWLFLWSRLTRTRES